MAVDDRDLEVLDEPTWRARARGARRPGRRLVAPHLERRRRGGSAPGRTTSSSPTTPSARPRCAAGTRASASALPRTAPRTYAGLKGYAVRRRGVAVTAEHVAGPAPLLDTLTGCSRRPRPGRRSSAASGCTSGRWSTGSEDETRHADWPLRLGPAGTDEVVESHRIALLALRRLPVLHRRRPGRCNTLQPDRDDRATSSSRAACTPGWTSTSTPSGSPHDLLRAGGGLLRAGPRHPRARHARRRRTTSPTWGYEPVRDRDRRRASRSTSPRSAPSPSGALRCAPGSSTECDRLLSAVDASARC